MAPWINLPNFFTFIRLAMVPFIIEAVITGHHQLALALFAIAAVTDVLDGAAARHFGLTTTAGAYFDPIADKCLLSGVFLALAVAQIVPWWFVAIVFARDIYILAGAAIIAAFTPVRKFPPSVWGKASTFVQISTAGVWMGCDALRIPALDAPATALLWLSTGFTVWSGIHYTWRGVQAVRAH
jgi:cardiolipin synthase